MEPEDSLRTVFKRACPEPDESSPHLHILFSCRGLLDYDIM